jgi:hypothetical protein
MSITDEEKHIRKAMMMGRIRVAMFIATLLWGLWYLYYSYVTEGMTVKFLFPPLAIGLVYIFTMWWAAVEAEAEDRKWYHRYRSRLKL